MDKKKVNFEEVVYFQEGPGVRNWQFRDSGIKLINIRNLVENKLFLENTSNYLDEEEVEIPSIVFRKNILKLNRLVC